MVRKFMTFAAVCVVAWMIFAGAGGGDSEKDAGDENNGGLTAVGGWLPEKTACWALSQSDVIYSARYALKGYLRDAGSAKFPVWPGESYRINDLGNDTYIAAGRVTAKNRFGVMSETAWRVRLKFGGRGMETVNVSEIAVGGIVVYNAP